MENKNAGVRLSSYGIHPSVDIRHILEEAEKVEHVRQMQMAGQISLYAASVEIEKHINIIWAMLDVVR